MLENMSKNNLNFPKDFIFGAATAAYQIEGAWNQDGRGKSIWDTFCHTSGKIRSGHTGDTACDHYHRYEEDVGIMQALNLSAYRFSISWSRVLPKGSGQVNNKGIDYYQRLVDCLLKADITPYVTLFHWDMPQTLQDSIGGFESRECSKYFADYTRIVVDALGDRVKHWITLNEIQDYALNGYFLGEHAPGKVRPWQYLKVIHNQLLAHGRALQAIRAESSSALIGPALNILPIHPMTSSLKDRESAKMANEFFNHATLGPIFKGAYSEDLLKRLRWFSPKIETEDMALISAPIDFLGINNYSREKAMYKWYIPILKLWMTGDTIAETESVKDGVQYTSMGWEVYPESIYEAITMVKNTYGNPPIFITENGAAFNDNREGDKVHDPKRVSFLNDYLAMVKKAIDDGAQVKGYFVWSLMDNFEWSVGFDKRFGLVYVDFATQERIIKDSGYWYRDLISAQNGKT